MIKDKGRKDYDSERPYMKSVKHFTHRKNRRATKNFLKSHEYDRIPKNKLTKEEDPWGWN